MTTSPSPTTPTIAEIRNAQRTRAITTAEVESLLVEVGRLQEELSRFRGRWSTCLAHDSILVRYKYDSCPLCDAYAAAAVEAAELEKRDEEIKGLKADNESLQHRFDMLAEVSG